MRRFVIMKNAMSVDSVEVVKMALQSKIDMVHYYEKAADLVRNDDAIAIFRGLAEKEYQQRNKLVKIYSELSGKKILYLNLGRKHKLNTLERCSDDPNEAVRKAKKNETELRNFDLMVSKRVYDPELREFFRSLAMEEEQHLALLESSFEEPLHLDVDSERNSNKTYREFASANSHEVKTW